MAVRAARNVSFYGENQVKNKVCAYWLEGRCTRNPCRFMHRKSPPPPQTNRPHQPTKPDSIHRNQSRNTTWRNPNNPKTNSNSYQSTPQKKVLESSARKNGDRKINITPQKVLENTAKKNGDRKINTTPQKVSESTPQKVSTDEPEKSNSIQKAHQPNQCKYWVTDNCVQGEKCKDLHSWFSGSGFTMLAKLEGHSKAVTGVSLPSGSDKLYSGGRDGFIKAWDCNSGQCVGSLSLEGEIGCLISEGPWVFVGLPNTIKAWNLKDQSEFSLGGPNGLVHCIVVDNDMIIAGVEDGSILVWKWNPETNIFEPAAMMKEHNGAVCSLFVGKANRLYSSSRDCTVKVWDLQNMQCMHTLHGHTREVTSVVCWDSYLFSASLDNTLKVWSATASGALEVVYEIKEDYGVIALCGMYDAEEKPILLCSYKDNTVRIYDLPSFCERGRIFSKREAQVVQIGTGGLFFTGDASGEISVWRLLGDPCAIS